MKYNQRFIAAAALLLTIVVASLTVQAEDKYALPEPFATTGVTPAMQKSMDPNTWTDLMAMMMDPSKGSPMGTCAACHEGEDLARYQEQFGPMMQAMWEPYKAMMNPHMMNNMMNPMMAMMNPMAMMGPMMGMMGPMMNPMMMSSMMYPMMGMMGGMGNPMAMMNPMTMMNPMMMGGMANPMGMMGAAGHGAANPAQMMDPKQYEQMFNSWTEMMKNMAPQAGNKQ